jgi:hypothetical protein
MAVAAIARREWCFKWEGDKVDVGSSAVWDGEELQRLQWPAVVGSLYFTSFGEGKG